jgi:FMN phosphatase YigB (HAD superfamily)
MVCIGRFRFGDPEGRERINRYEGANSSISEERAYNHAMEVLGVGPDETWMVGDNLEWEIVAPQRLGIYAIWHDGYGVGLPRNSPIRPDRIIRRLSELLL